MTRSTIDLGIDLGTTNSCAAVFGDNGPEIVRIGDRDYLPSVVHVKNGVTRVGETAYNALFDPKRCDDVHCEFKRLMGSPEPLTFSSSGITKTPEDLAADVLREISNWVEQRLDERMRAAVITVPAWFESVQREATLRAGRAAGFDEVLLLQEPIAAALGYGFGLDGTCAETWLVFDQGGGTLDVAIVQRADGELRIIDHHGNNFHGGKDLDWLVLEHLVQPVLADEYEIPPFDKADGFWRVLKPLAESAKIDLSNRDSTWLDIDERVTSLDGRPIAKVIEMRRSDHEQLIEEWVDEAIGLCPELLHRSGIGYDRISRILLVGGPTNTPLMRRRIVERLGVPVEIQGIDPMTVVARGAAVYAASKQHSVAAVSVPDSDVATLELHYKPVYADLDPVVSGKITQGCAITSMELIRADGEWSSGKLSLVDGTFMVRVLLTPARRNVFTVRAYDPSGTLVPTIPSALAITQGLEAAPATLPMSYKVPVAENDGQSACIVADVLIPKGTTLPCSRSVEYRTRFAVSAGSDDHILNVHVVEGEYDMVDLNRHVGTLSIRGMDITRNLPENSEMQVSLRVDENGIPTVSAYIPYLDKSVSEVLKNRSMPTVSAEDLECQIYEDQNRLQSLVEQLDEVDEDTEIVDLREEALSTQDRLGEIEAQLSDDGVTTPDDLQRVDRERKDVMERVEQLAAALEFPGAIAAFEATVEWAENTIEVHGHDEDKEILSVLVAEARDAIDQHDLHKLKERRSEIAGRAWQVLFLIPDFWIGTFQDMNANRYRFTDQVRADTLLTQGCEALSMQDIDGLKVIVWELWGLYPEASRQETSRRFLDTGLRKS